MQDKVILGPKDPKNPEEYQECLKFLEKDLKIVKRKWILSLKYEKTGESLQYKTVHFKREYVPQLLEALTQLDIASVAQLPREKDGCAFYLDVRYVKSGQLVCIQLIEARVGADGGYFCRTPAMVFLDEEATKVYDQIKVML